MVLCAIIFALALGLDAKPEARRTNSLAGMPPTSTSYMKPVKTEGEVPVELSGMRDEPMAHVAPALDRREMKLLEQAGFANASAALKGKEQEQHYPDTPKSKGGSSLTERLMEVVKQNFGGKSEADPASNSREVPYYFFNFPIAVKFIDDKGKAKIAILDRVTLPGELPIEFMYVYPMIFFLLYSFVWCLCCRRSNRTGLSFRLVVEAAACFMCLWADLATKHKVISSGRAWSYVIMMMVLLSAWNIAELVVKDNDATNTLVFWTFQSIVAFVWIAYSIERMYVRKFYRRSADPMAAAHPMADCVAVACCGQFTALQEAQLMSNTQQDQSASKTHW